MKDEEFNNLSIRYLEDQLDEDGRDQLNRELLSSTDWIRQFNDLRMLAGLMLDHGRTGAEKPKVLAFRREKTRPGSWEWKQWGAAAALLMMGLFAGLFLRERTGNAERDGKALTPVSTILMDIDFENATAGSLEGIPKVSEAV